jgi:uncharacterized membrane protein
MVGGSLPAKPRFPDKRGLLRWAAILLALALYVGFALYFGFHTGVYRLYRSSGSANVRYEKATVLAIEDQELETDREHGGLVTGYQDILIRLTSGERAGTELKIQNVLNYTTHFLLKRGDSIIAHVDTADASNFTVSVYSVDRAPALGLLALLFVAALCGIGGRRGFRSLLGIAFTFASIVFIFIPLLYRGCSPALAAAVMGGATATVSLLLLSGPSAKGVSAIAGSLAGIAISAALALAFQRLAQISGYSTAEADSLLAISGRTGMNVGELLFAAFLISTLGAEMDISISVASAVDEVRVGNPGLKRSELFRAGMNVGRDIMGTMANTLVLAFLGTSLNAVILMYSLERSSYQLLNSNAIAIELAQSLCAGLAIVLTVPAVAFVASRAGPRA